MLKHIDWHAISEQELFDALHTTKEGLMTTEANRRLLKHGTNSLPKSRSTTWLTLLIQQFTSPLMIVLLCAAGVSLALQDTVDAGVISVAILLNSLLGFIQEYKANQAMEKLRQLVQPTALVRRDGHDLEIDASELVRGDVVILRAGDRISADARLFECFGCEVNEAALTGESGHVQKKVCVLDTGTGVSDRTNMVFTGTSMVIGRLFAVVVATGVDTELGKIAQLVQSTSEQNTPLQDELARLAKWLSFGVAGIVTVLFGVGILYGRGSLEMFQTSVALAVAAIPEGLGISVTIVLAIGMQRMVKHHALIRRLVAAETLGSVSVICTDKTGTITEGRMRVDEVTGNRDAVLEAVVLCNDAILDGDTVLGSPTERALLEAGMAAGLHPAKLIKDAPRIAEIPFDSAKKYMVTMHEKDGKTWMILKGAPERVLTFCHGSDGHLQEAARLADQGLRLIAVAKKTISHPVTNITDADLQGFVFTGFVGLRDPLRKEAAEQIRVAKLAGVRTVIVTGDHPKTARAIGVEAGLHMTENAVVTGVELDAWDDAALDHHLSRIQIFARVEPRHKIRVVQAWQRSGAVVAVTGDGVNDAPALKAADIGVALGSGTEVAKEASDMVLLDDNLSSITTAIEQGRVIFDNMRRSVVYLFTSGFTEMILIAGSLLLGLPLPLLPAQILWINLVADTFPNAALAFEKGEPGIMLRPPRKRGEAVFNRQMAVLLLVIGVVTDLILFGLYLWILPTKEVEVAQTFMFAAVGIASLVYVFSIRSFHRSLFRLNPFSNPFLIGAVAISFAMLVFAIQNPWLSSVLHATPLALSDWGLLAMIGAGKLFIIETAKTFTI